MAHFRVTIVHSKELTIDGKKGFANLVHVENVTVENDSHSQMAVISEVFAVQQIDFHNVQSLHVEFIAR